MTISQVENSAASNAPDGPQGSGNVTGTTDATGATDAPGTTGTTGTTGGLSDIWGRQINYARISLTDRCNFRCIYCMPHEGLPFIPHGQILSYEELLRLCSLMTGLGINRYKVTGGEPFSRKGASGFIKNLAALPGVEEVTITTNGALVAPHLEDLAQAGIRSITFSLDAIEQHAFERICRAPAKLDEIMAAMQQAAGLGLRVKINAVPLLGYNEDQLVPLARFGLEQGYHVRFIELMPVGLGKALRGLPLERIFSLMRQNFGPFERLEARTGNGPAVMYKARGYTGYIGFIAALSGRFCENCNRVRLVSTGFLKTCLCHDFGVDLRTPLRDGAANAELVRIIREAVREKPKGHDFSFSSSGKGSFNMHSVGG